VIVAVAVAGFGLLALPTLLRPIGRRLPPSWWAKLCAAALLAGFAVVIGAGVISSLPTALWITGLPRAAHACEAMFGLAFSIGSPFALLTMATTLSITVLGARALWRFRQMSRHSWVESVVGKRLPRSAQFEVVVLESPLARALSVPGSADRPGQVLLTTGLVDALPPEELDLVFAHEEAHLALGHHRYLALAAMIEGSMWGWPPAKASTRALRLALERWADEIAAGDSVEFRSRLASALVAVAVDAHRPVLAAFSALEGLVERLAAMREPSGTRVPVLWWPVLLVPGVVFGAVSLYALARLGGSAYCVVSMPTGCHLLQHL